MRGVLLASAAIRSLAISLLAIGLLACQERTEGKQRPQPLTAAPIASPAKPEATPQRVSLPISAYGVRIDFDGDTLVLASARGLRLFPKAGAASEVARDFGTTFALSGSRVVYFAAGELLESRRGEPPHAIGSVPEQPKLMAVSQEELVWVTAARAGGSTLWTLRAGGPQKIAQLRGGVDTLALSDGWAFFFEQGPSGTWRLGGAPLAGGPPISSEWRSGRVPATLSARDQLVYYDGPTRSVHRVSRDLAHDEILGRGVICSPLAALDRVVCARVGGLFELPLDGGEPKELVKQGGFVTAVAVGETGLAWVTDVGSERLVVQRTLL